MEIDVSFMHPGWRETMKRIIEAKEARRRKLAALSYPEKVKIIVQMQKRLAPIYAARGIRMRVWEIEET